MTFDGVEELRKIRRELDLLTAKANGVGAAPPPAPQVMMSMIMMMME
jgi:hypothetical protein